MAIRIHSDDYDEPLIWEHDGSVWGEESGEEYETPDPGEKLDGTPSYEFGQEDLDAAEEASDAVKEYCADAVSEAQRLGCESHVTEDEIP